MTEGITDKTADGLIADITEKARQAAAIMAQTSGDHKTTALKAAAQAIRDQKTDLLAANARDMAAAGAKDHAAAFLDRLALTPDRVAAMAEGLEAVAEQADPIGAIVAEWDRPNGLHIQRVRVPLGVIGIIYESRPNVTADAGGLCLKSGNAAILRGGSESFHSSTAIAACLQTGLRTAGLPEDVVQLVPTRDRAAVGAMLTAAGGIDVIIPRGGKSLIARVQAESRVPVLAHLDGICHVYVDRDADLAMARAIVLNAKMRRTGICGAAETLLVDRALAATHLPSLIDDLLAAGCEVRGDPETQAANPAVIPATAADWDTEYLAPIIAVKLVDGADGAIAHIAAHSSHHTESIITENAATADRFLRQIDSAIVLWNASTQFADGGEFGMGAEIGISTGRLHARGPVGAEELTSIKYIVTGHGQTRP